jgi:hypothetical protein
MATAKTTSTKTEEEAAPPLVLPPKAPPLQETLVSEPVTEPGPIHVTDVDAMSYALVEGAKKTFVPVEAPAEVPAPTE